MDLTFYKYEFGKAGEQIKGYTISKMIKLMKLLCEELGLPESTLTIIIKPFSIFITLQSIM